MKKTTALIAVLLSFILLCTACSVTEGDAAPLTVNGTAVDGEVFRYFLDEAIGEDPPADRDGVINFATEQCIRYVAVNTAFQTMELSLDPAARAAASEEANALWRMFHAHYEAIDVSKETFIKLYTADAYRETLREALYGENGETPIDEDVLKGYFAEHYNAVRYVDGLLYTTDENGDKKTYDEETRQRVFAKFEQTAQQINAGSAAEVLFASLPTAMGIDLQQHLSTEIIAADTPGLPAGFFQGVEGLKIGKAGVLLLSDHVYLVLRVDVFSDETLFENNRAACLRAVSEAPLLEEISRLSEEFTSVRKTRAALECYTTVKDGRRA
ncbi:MAG: hypothetical protein IJT27_08910 [Clostridia bacterium]|nr:hypothetical protein [Clostridia bacterium]